MFEEKRSPENCALCKIALDHSVRHASESGAKYYCPMCWDLKKEEYRRFLCNLQNIKNRVDRAKSSDRNIPFIAWLLWPAKMRATQS